MKLGLGVGQFVLGLEGKAYNVLAFAFVFAE